MCVSFQKKGDRDMPQALAYFRGQTVPVSEAKVSIMTHALHYGTAVFEGVRGNWNQEQGKMFIFRLREHYERLMRGCRILMMDVHYSVDELCEITVELVRSCGYTEDVYIRPIAYKSTELVANLKLHELDSDFALMVVPFGSYIETEGAIRCCTSSWRRMDDTNTPSSVKIAGNYINSILAKTEAVLAGFDEGILLNKDGTVSEGTGENLFLVIDGALHTPPISDNILNGITRDSVFQLARNELGLDIIERHISRSELYLANELFLTGTAAHVMPVGYVDNRPVGDGEVGPVTGKLRDLYASAVRGNSPKYLHWCSAVTMEG
jgi:branched-chain amino acid aminotransferase